MSYNGKGRKWTDEDNKFLIENYATIGTKKCAEILKATYHSTQFHARLLGLKMYSNKKWTEEDIKYLSEHFPVEDTQIVANYLNRSWFATHKMANKLGISKQWTYNYICSEGYRVLCHDRDNKIHEHRAVMEQKLGRKLTSQDIVHHIDGNKLNNNSNNLMLTNRSDHIKEHMTEIQQARVNTRDSLNSMET